MPEAAETPALVSVVTRRADARARAARAIAVIAAG
jgi:hypothetical protein